MALQLAVSPKSWPVPPGRKDQRVGVPKGSVMRPWTTAPGLSREVSKRPTWRTTSSPQSMSPLALESTKERVVREDCWTA